MHSSLSGLEQTLLLPLWARAQESLRPDAIISDPGALELLRRIEFDPRPLREDWKSQLAVAIRTRLIDEAVLEFLARHDQALVVNLGAGLDCRFERIDDGRLLWYDLDLPEVIELRRELLGDRERVRTLAHSVFDTDWMDAVREDGRAVLLVAEGLLMYFSRRRVRDLIRRLGRRFPGAEMLLEVLAFGAVGMAAFHASLRRFGAALKWAPSDCHELERWSPGLRVLAEECVLDHHPERWGWLAAGAANPWLRLTYGERVLHLRFGRESRGQGP